MRMELIENLLQLLTTFVGALLSGISYRKSRRQAYFMLLCFYGCFALGALYWTLYLLLFDTTPRVFYVSEFGWVASVIFLRILQATLTGTNERSFRCRRAWLALAFGVPLLAFYCTFGDILSNLIWCGMMIWLSFCAIRGLAYTWRRTWLKVAGTCGLLGAVITLHAIYNLLIAYGGAAQYVAYALPVLLVAAGRLSVFRLSRKQ